MLVVLQCELAITAALVHGFTRHFFLPMDNHSEFESLLGRDVDPSHLPPAERLCAILRGLFDCLQDLNQRLADLEAREDGRRY